MGELCLRGLSLGPRGAGDPISEPKLPAEAHPSSTVVQRHTPQALSCEGLVQHTP